MESVCSKATWIVPFSTLSEKQDTAHSSIGFFRQCPVRTLNFQPCQGHWTRSPSNVPSPKGPPACGQVLSRANSSPLTLNRATPRPVLSNSTERQDPGGRSDNFAASIYFNGFSLTLASLSSQKVGILARMLLTCKGSILMTC